MGQLMNLYNTMTLPGLIKLSSLRGRNGPQLWKQINESPLPHWVTGRVYDEPLLGILHSVTAHAG